MLLREYLQRTRSFGFTLQSRDQSPASPPEDEGSYDRTTAFKVGETFEEFELVGPGLEKYKDERCG